MKTSHASSFLSRKRCFSSAHACQYPRLRCRSSRLLVVRSSRIESAHLPVASTKKPTISSTIVAAFRTMGADCGRAPRPVLFGLETPRPAERLWVAGGGLPTAGVANGWLVAADAVLSSCIIVARRCEPPHPMLGASMCSVSSKRSPGGWSHTTETIFSD